MHVKFGQVGFWQFISYSPLPKKNRTRWFLKRQIISHIGDTKHVCAVCGARFASSCNLHLQEEKWEENPQKLTQLSSRSHPRHLVGKRTAQKDTIIDITSDSQVNNNFPYRWSPASLTFNN